MILHRASLFALLCLVLAMGAFPAYASPVEAVAPTDSVVRSFSGAAKKCIIELKILRAKLAKANAALKKALIVRDDLIDEIKDLLAKEKQLKFTLAKLDAKLDALKHKKPKPVAQIVVVIQKIAVTKVAIKKVQKELVDARKELVKAKKAVVVAKKVVIKAVKALKKKEKECKKFCGRC